MYSEEEKLELIKEFVTEGRELLDDVEPQIIAMEKEVDASGRIDQDILNAIFRLFHSLKGAASFFDLQNIIGVTHEAETLLDLFRKGRAVVDPKHVDLLCRATDFVRTALEQVEQDFTDKGFEETAASIVNELKRTIAAISADQEVPSETQAGDSFSITPPGESEGFDRPGSGETDSEELRFVVTPEMVKRFAEEAAALCDEAESALLSLEREPGNLEHAGQAFRALHSLKGNAGFMGYGELEEISHHAETLLDAVREGHKDADSVAISFLLIAVDSLREGIRQVSNGVALDIAGKEELVRHLDLLGGGTGGDSSQDKSQDLCAATEPVKYGQSKAGEVGTDKPNGSKSDWAKKEYASGQQEGQQADIREKQASSSGRQQVIRIDIDKLDTLLDLVGELVIAEAMVAHNPDLTGLQLERFEKAVLQLDKITRDIQEVAMSMRMIPLAGTFRKMVRLVRDLAHKANKKVDLEIIGEETEVDKTIIEQISDPLVHLIRNAVDHGLETPEERVAGGKPETAKITLEAKHSAGEVWIVVQDDGRGLDREKILRKAVEKGLVKSEDQDLKDEEVWRFIFEPGFSTAEQVSSVSGRGVGMDVVKRNIEKLRGKVDIRSRFGFGTMFIIRIPLTLAIIEGMVVRVGHNRYTIPISSIKESIQPRPDQITRTPDNLEIVRIRGELMPVIRLHELYRVKPVFEELTDGILIIVESNNQKYCLFVDELLGQQQIVIKGLSSYFGRVRGMLGCSILGDGDISMILDVADLVSSIEGTVLQAH